MNAFLRSAVAVRRSSKVHVLLVAALAFLLASCAGNSSPPPTPTPQVLGITIDQGTLVSVEVGSSVALSATVTVANGASTGYTWFSNDPAIATVSVTGTVVGVSAGSVVIVARSSADQTKSASITVNVTAREPEPEPRVVSVLINQRSGRTMEVGASLVLSATVTVENDASRAVTWSTSDASIASITSTGQVRGVSGGVATITATSDFDPSKSDSMLVTVNPPRVVSVSIEPSEDQQMLIGDSLPLSASVVVIGDVPQGVDWSTSDADVAVLNVDGDAIEVTAVGVGTAVITAASVFDSTKRAEVLVTVSKAPTLVGGRISRTTTWRKADSPFMITERVEVPFGVRLTIEPGVTVIGDPRVSISDGEIRVWGTLNAIGTEADPIILENVYVTGGSNTKEEPSSIALRYIHVYGDSGILEGSGYGNFSLRDSQIHSYLNFVYIWYPVSVAYVERNVFYDGVYFSVGHREGQVVIKNNRFKGAARILNWAAYEDPTVVTLNTFESPDSRVGLREGYDNAAMRATSNYWGTTVDAEIQEMIFDENDSLDFASVVPYKPFLSADHVNTP